MNSAGAGFGPGRASAEKPAVRGFMPGEFGWFFMVLSGMLFKQLIGYERSAQLPDELIVKLIVRQKQKTFL